IECGGHYVRAMSSWSILLALSGFHYDGIEHILRFAPAHTPENFKSFFIGPEGYGMLKQTRMGKSQRNEIHVAEGKFNVSRVILKPAATVTAVRASIGRAPINARIRTRMDGVEVMLESPMALNRGQTLAITLLA